MYFDIQLINSIITGFWIFIGIVLLITNKITQNGLYSALGITCIITSISSYLIINYMNFGGNYYIKYLILIILGAVIFFVINKKAKLNNYEGLRKKNSE